MTRNTLMSPPFGLAAGHGATKKNNPMKPTRGHFPSIQDCRRLSLDLLGLAVAGVFVLPVAAETRKGGLINGETWTKANSPYILTNTIQVKKLTIEPGVQVLSDGTRNSCEIEVDGDLKAIGTAEEAILFSRTTNGTLKWSGIRFNGPSDSELAHCVIEQSSNRGDHRQQLRARNPRLRGPQQLHQRSI